MKKYLLLFFVGLFCHQYAAAQTGIAYHNALGAAKEADSFLVARIDGKQTITSLYLLPSHSKLEKSVERSGARW